MPDGWGPARRSRLILSVCELRATNDELRAENRALGFRLAEARRTIEGLAAELAALSDPETRAALDRARDPDPAAYVSRGSFIAAGGVALIPETVVLQAWDESEAGWGIRSDGYSLHLTEADRVAAINAYWESMPASVPSEYSRPAGNPILVKVGDGGVPVDIARKLSERTAEQGYRSYDRIPKEWRQ